MPGANPRPPTRVRCNVAGPCQRYLAEKKQPPPLGSPKGPRLNPTVGSYGGAVSCERGILVLDRFNVTLQDRYWTLSTSQGLLMNNDENRPTRFDTSLFQNCLCGHRSDARPQSTGVTRK